MEIATSPEGNASQESAHRLHGVPAKLSISLEHLPDLAPPDGACASAEDLPGSAATTTSPTESVVSAARPEDELQITPEEPRAGSPWADADDTAEDKPEDTATSAKKAGVHKQAWTGDEDSKLLELVERHGASNWSRIAADLPSRIGKQCRERWHNHLSPAVKKESFSAEEDHAIMQAVAEHGTKWAHIVKLIPGRTDNAIKNRWNSTTRKLWRVQKRCGDLVPGLQEVDFTTMDAAAVAKHLLARGITAAAAVPPKPPAKRRLSLKADGGSSSSADADADADAAENANGEGEAGTPPPTTSKRKRTSGGRKRSSAAAADGLALLRAATFRSATYTLMEAAAAAASGEEEDGAEEEASTPREAAEGVSVAAVLPLAAADGGGGGEPSSCNPPTPAAHASGGGGEGSGFTLDALTLLAQSSVVRSQEAGCRSPRMLEAALALGGAFDVPCLH